MKFECGPSTRDLYGNIFVITFFSYKCLLKILIFTLFY